jgi:hypothetical protein
VQPHLAPYYDTYAAQYVDVVKPYYSTLDRNVFVPTRAYTIKYGAPRVAQAQALARAQWDKNIQPQLSVYQGMAREYYDKKVGPHVDQAFSVASPYYTIARTNALQTYHEILLPSYQFLRPYALRGYIVAADFATETAIPSAFWAWEKTNRFLDATIWPRVRILYAENVEPQLVRIGNRLGRHQEPQKGAAATDIVARYN